MNELVLTLTKKYIYLYLYGYKDLKVMYNFSYFDLVSIYKL